MLGIDIDQRIVEGVNKGRSHIKELGLEKIVKESVEKGFLRASVKAESSDYFIITEPTPFKSNHIPDTSFIKSAISSIAQIIEVGNLIILESTSPVGTTEEVSSWLA